MADHWVINASPVILLSKAEIIQFLPDLCEELVVPQAVVGEVENAHFTDAGKIWLEGDGKKYIRPSPQTHPALAKWSGGKGEAEVISWALYHAGFTAVLDDGRARSLARRNGVSVLGSLGVIVVAKKRGLIPKARIALEKLRGAGAYVSDRWIDYAIELAGEK